jgi:hypothetical protein
VESILIRLRKIEALARDGIGGERENARRMLGKLCAKHGVTLEELTEETRLEVPFSVRGTHDKQLLFQVYAFIRNASQVTYRVKKRKPNLIWFSLTRAEAIDMRECFDHYRLQWKKQSMAMLDDLLSAFIQKNRIFPPPSDHEEEPDTIDIERIARLRALMGGIESSPWERHFRLDAPHCLQHLAPGTP